MYEYKRAESIAIWGEAGGKLIWSSHREGNVYISGTPYELFIWIKPAKVSMGTVEINNVNITDIESGKSCLISKEPSNAELEKDESGTIAYFSFPKQNLDYKKYRVTFDVSIKTKDGIQKEAVSLLFEKDYREKRFNILWETLMSV